MFLFYHCMTLIATLVLQITCERFYFRGKAKPEWARLLAEFLNTRVKPTKALHFVNCNPTAQELRELWSVLTYETHVRPL